MTFIEKIDVLKLLYESSVELCKENLIIKMMKLLTKQLVCYHMTLIKITNEFKEKLRTIYDEDLH